MPERNVKFSDQSWETIEELERLTSADSPSEVIRDALSVYWWMTRQHREGTRFLAQRGLRIKKVVFPTFDPDNHPETDPTPHE